MNNHNLGLESQVTGGMLGLPPSKCCGVSSFTHSPSILLKRWSPLRKRESGRKTMAEPMFREINEF